MATILEQEGRSLYEYKLVPGTGYAMLPSGLIFDDSLTPTNYDTSVQLNPYITMNKPFLSSNMRTVTDKSVVEKMNNTGAMGVMHQFEPLAVRVETVRTIFDAKVNKAKYPDANSIDEDNTPLIAVAVGYEEAEEASLALFRAGARVIIFDSSNGYTPSFLKRVERSAKNIRYEEGGEQAVIGAGNVATPKGADALLTIEELDLLKLGVGSGTACITGKHGVHIPQFDVIFHTMPVIEERGKIGISDGGAKDSAGVNIALTVAHLVMAGSLFAATHDAPNEKGQDEEGRWYALYQGSASWEDRSQRAEEYPDRYSLDKTSYRPSEGRSGWMPIKGTIYEVVDSLAKSLHLDMNYVGGVDPEGGKYTLGLFRKYAELIHLSEQALRDMNKGGNFVKIHQGVSGR